MKNGSPDVRRVSGEIDVLRRDLGAILSELDRRRHELLDVRLQMRRHPAVVVGVAAAAALLVGGTVAVLLRSRRRRAQPATRVRETRRALARLLEHPQRVAAEPSMPAKIATAVGVAAGSVVARHLARAAMRRVTPSGAARG